MVPGGIKFFRAGGKLSRGQRYPIRDGTIEGLRSGKLNLRRVRHIGKYPLRRLNRLVVVPVDLRQLVHNLLRQAALFSVPNSVESEDEALAILFLSCPLRLGFNGDIRGFVNTPKHDNLTMLALADRSAKIVCLLERQPVRRYVLGRL